MVSMVSEEMQITYGIRGNANNLLASFLANRKQYVFLNHTQFNYRYIKCGVPQGSVLGPLLFTIYINDISSSTNSASMLYADDTCLISHDDSISNLKHKIKFALKDGCTNHII